MAVLPELGGPIRKNVFFILVLVVFVYILELIYFSRTIPKIISITTVLHIEEEKIKNAFLLIVCREIKKEEFNLLTAYYKSEKEKTKRIIKLAQEFFCSEIRNSSSVLKYLTEQR